MKKIFVLILSSMVLFGCQKHVCDDVNPKLPGVNMVASTGTILDTKELAGEQGEITVKLLNSNTPADSYAFGVVNSDVLFYTSQPGEYSIEVSRGSKNIVKTINILPRDKKPTKYITRVLEYMPAPGQFINILPTYEEGDTQKTMNQKALEAIGGENRNSNMVSLGAWGGYVIFGFDHSVINVEGKADLRIDGNAFVANAIGDNLGNTKIMEGSVEPGVVFVSYDKNGNGLADDEWFEILGSGSLSVENEAWYDFMSTNYPEIDLTIHRDYEMTYSKPSSERPADPEKYIAWSDNKNKSSFMRRNEFHHQPYYPLWIKSESMTFRGTKLANNMYKQHSEGGFYLQLAYKYGYVDNVPNGHKNGNIDISWAVDKNGKKVKLPYIDFVKVQTGVYAIANTTGEVSTEVTRAMDLHIDPVEDVNSAEIVN